MKNEYLRAEHVNNYQFQQLHLSSPAESPLESAIYEIFMNLFVPGLLNTDLHVFMQD